MGAIEIARQQPRCRARCPADQFEVALRHAREMIVDDHGGDRRDETERGGEQGLGDAGRPPQDWWSAISKSDKAVHDAPHRAEQSDERRRRSDGGEQSHAEPDPAPFGPHDLGKARGRALLDAGIAGNSGRQPRLAHRRCQQRRQHATLAPSANCASASDLASLTLPSAARSLRWTSDSSIIFAMKMVHVTSEAKARPIMTALTRMSADMKHRPRGQFAQRNSCRLQRSAAIRSQGSGGGRGGLSGECGRRGSLRWRRCLCRERWRLGLEPAAAPAAFSVALMTAAGGSIASANIVPNAARNDDMFILRSRSKSFNCNACIRPVAFAKCRVKKPRRGPHWAANTPMPDRSSERLISGDGRREVEKRRGRSSEG